MTSYHVENYRIVMEANENPSAATSIGSAALNRKGSTTSSRCPPITVRTEMSSHTPAPNEERHWESVHKCSKCGYEHNLEKLDLDETTTGIATCPRCEWSGQIDLQIVPGQRLDE
jgi:hypothetical protein